MEGSIETTDVVFHHRLKAAAAAAWWVFLVGYVLLLLQYGVYLWVAQTHPAWMLPLWGPDFGWPDILRWWMAGTILYKIGLWMGAMGALWLTLWARRLRPS